ncbi:4-(cytidine 5'-diphospho)-2-C-methyl-D-erythritol kinase [Solemya velum gill symbiont]|nr:4-(cytidine 5'-diphospho)-2-C-methyl-D-erythritol kinase [Solemya velum gill symbiont]OOY35621.1 4-(cytidine 5'-diphospho)-2-C-methyl-D-erythritol kinase [Solemya velum gill symbiont]OOY38635.1 4-(cytidine 5'-diphospho)-2-C-methyl-D-erythritol kinase [Solemya velum gill symbiont]OOY39143.1 4-(cytidine 5'-diphospho)-2-C-methyl-D-erythritol kinase [Solemya velum gill symbiont]OOY42791.1 4-(cytidine 5'-diphospho)-2-C-methyl-D-erythritol kinase [Solemya velum gill symbiont]OOY46670.1 4-(cytidin
MNLAVNRFPAPAKLNLMLHITGRRDDGYHLLQTVFQFLDYGDELGFEVLESGEIENSTPPAGVAHDDDLIVKAARLLQSDSGTRLGARIELDKRLPMGGGLGGGSSDAATTLVALNRLWGLEYSKQQLADLGLQLGADVPIFVHGEAAWGEGVGEKLTRIELPERWFLVVRPDIHIETHKLFHDSELTRNCHPITIADFLAGSGENVFFPVVKRRYPAVAEIVDRLSALGDVKLTGTGSCLFIAFEDEKRAQDAATKLPQGLDYFVARGVNRSPLYAV